MGNDRRLRPDSPHNAATLLTARVRLPQTRRRLMRTALATAATTVLAAVMAATVGCTMFGGDTVVRSSDGLLLPPLSAPPDAVQLQLVFIERPVNDPLLGRCLWNELDQLAGVPHERRLSLLENGFRYAMSGSQPPPTLAELLKVGLANEYDGPTGFVNSRSLAMRDGAATDVMVSDDPTDWTVDVVRDGHPEQKQYPAARGFLRVDVSGVEDGWVEVNVTPEIHHGDEAVRHSASDAGWTLDERHEIAAVPDTSFSVHLALNEMLVLSAAEGSGSRVGNHFFRREDDGRLMQRVLVIRASAMKQDAALASR